MTVNLNILMIFRINWKIYILATDPQPIINDFINEIKTTDSRIVIVLVVRVQNHMEIYQSMLYVIRNQTFVNG